MELEEGPALFEVVVEVVGGAQGDEFVVAEDQVEGLGAAALDGFEQVDVGAELEDVLGLGERPSLMSRGR